MLTPMAKIERNRQGLFGNAAAAKTEIKEIGRVFSLMATVRQHGSRIKMAPLSQCMVALGMQNPGSNETETVDNLLRSAEGTDKAPTVVDVFRSKMAIRYAHLRLEHRRLRQDMQLAQRHARALRKLAANYVYRPGKTEAELVAR